ncbi:MAG: hypothetical protein J0L93_05150 [Deltaproteobacteria bacterium]|nr:hypothetical protein [Deltaproteobacteria bacterium]
MSAKDYGFERSFTVPDPVEHPVKSFFENAGLDVSRFPQITFLLETTEKQFRAHKVCLPIRLPNQIGYVYEAACRVLKTLEVPLPASGHRKFLEIEIQIEEIPIHEDDFHETLAFLASEILCISCREVFNPDPEIVDQNAVKVTCPDCLSSWLVKIEQPGRLLKPTSLLLDLYQENPSNLAVKYNDWESQPIQADDEEYYSIFPYHFDYSENSSATEYLFGEVPTWKSLSNGTTRDFESLCKGFLNSITMNFFRNTKLLAPIARLDQTEIQRKSEITKKTTEAEILKQTEKSESKAIEWPVPNILSLPKPASVTSNASKPYSLKDKVSRTAFALAGAAALGFIIAVLLDNIPKPSNSNSLNKEAARLESEISSATNSIPSAANIQTPSEKAEANSIESIQSRAHSLSLEKTSPIPAQPHFPKNQETPQQKKLAEAEKNRLEQIENSFRQGMLHLKLQQTAQAALEFQHVIDLDPANAASYRGLGLSYVYDQRFEDAIKAFEKYLKISKESFDRTSVEELIQSLKERLVAQQ